ncbi:daf-6 [Cordylochernes scorpioides]|uniref:Daf-6 n=1 Tax=Cordylochernes scorpioides TaxID=51811 RepID=A0ABY6LLW6_9ARAC|nr:daf-6 [Cordylochernes scorpioides]
MQIKGKNKTIYNFIFYRENPDKSSTTYKSSNFSNAFAKFTTSCTTSSRGRSIIFTFYIMYLAVSLWGTVNIKEDFKETDVFFHESYLHDQFKSFYEYFNDYHMRIHLVIEEPIPYWEPKTQETLKNFTVEVENLPFMTGENLTESWIRYYSNFINANQNFFRTDYTNRKVFIYNLRNFYLKINPYKSYYHDIVFNKNYTEIIASRIFVQTSKVNKTSDLRYVVNSLREVAARYPYKISVYHPFFWVADHLNKVAWITMTSLSTAVVILLVISLIFIPSIKFCLITGFAIISIQIGVLGLSSLWSVDLNNLTNVSLIISVGFSIDNISHVLSSYYSSKKRDAKAKLTETFKFVGLPIFYGYATSCIALFALILAQSAVYINIFKVIFTVLTISLAHSIFILPILLSVFDKPNNNTIRPEVQYNKVPAQITQEAKLPEQDPLPV